MSTEIFVRSVGPFRAEDRSWLGSAHGTTATRTVTLDVSAFTAGTHYPNGYIASGTVISQIGSTNLWGPYTAGAVSSGHLFNSIPITSSSQPDVGVPVLEHGVIRVSNLPANSGLTPAARTELSDRGLIYRDN